MSVLDLGIHLTDAERHFANIAAGADPLENAHSGLQAVLRAAATSEPVTAFPALAEEIGVTMRQVTPIIAEAAGKWITRELTHMGMGAAAALVTGPASDPLRYDQQCYAALLRCDLSAAICRREIARRGDPLTWAIVIRRAWSASDHSEHLLQ